jgi:hypothetical protein
MLLGLIACNNDNDWKDDPSIIPPEPGMEQGLYILNEGGWGSNNSTLTYYDYDSGKFINNYFVLANPGIEGLGDTGNDIKIYGSKLYAAINTSNYVEVMDAKTAKHIGKIQIANVRSLAFDKGFAYITSFAGTVSDGQQVGYVAKVDTANLSIIEKVEVGHQPEELTVANNKLYVANSGGYNYPNYSNEVSVISIDLNNFKVVKIISIGVFNLSKIRTDKNGKVWIISKGNYDDIATSLSVIDPETDKVTNTWNVNITDFDFYEDNLYFYGSTYSMSTGKYINSYGVININTKQQTASHIFDSSLEAQITIPYGLTINPKNGDIFLSDALDYLSSGKVYCFSKDGSQKWVKTAGIIPGHFAFLYK